LPTVVWLHVSPDIDAMVVEQLCEAILDKAPAVEFVLTRTGDAPVAFKELGSTAVLPDANATMVKAFVDQWKPVVGLWLDSQLNSVVLRGCTANAVPLHLVDTGHAAQAARGGFMRRIVGSVPLRHFLSITVGSLGVQRALLRAGANSATMSALGMLEQVEPCLPVNAGERDHFSQLLSTRPIWLAANANLEELDAIMEAHARILRRAHRLILVLVPANLNDSDEMAVKLRGLDTNFARRSEGEEPTSETHVFLADTADELGLWFRVAPVSFLGQTMAGPQDASPHPFEAAALGSAMVHGPNTGVHALAYERLARVQASRVVADLDGLAFAVETMLAPDVAAQMAHAAWQTSTAAAQVMDHVSDLAVQHLPISGRLAP